MLGVRIAKRKIEPQKPANPCDTRLCSCIFSVNTRQRRVSVFDTLRFFRSFAAKNQRALGCEAPFYPPPACRTQSASHWFESSHSDQHRVSVFDTLCFFVLLSQRTSGLLGAKRRLICAGSKPVAPGRVSSDGTSRFFAYFLRSLHKNVHFLAVFSLFVEEHLFLLLAEERKSMYYKRCTGEILVRKSDDSPGWVRWTHYAEGKTHCEECLMLDGCWFRED